MSPMAPKAGFWNFDGQKSTEKVKKHQVIIYDDVHGT